MVEGVLYWYKVEQIATDGTNEFFGPISVVGVNSPPSDFELFQNFPNPFNPETQIMYAVPEESHVSIDVFNVAGKRINTLVNTNMDSGYHTVVWDGTDTYGTSLPGGLYLCRIQAGTYEKIIRMLFVK